MTFVFLVAYHFLSAMYLNLAYATFIFYLYSCFFYSPRWRFVLQTEISGKYNSSLYFVLSLFFLSITLSCRKDQFTVLSLKFGKKYCLTWPQENINWLWSGAVLRRLLWIILQAMWGILMSFAFTETSLNVITVLEKWNFYLRKRAFLFFVD